MPTASVPSLLRRWVHRLPVPRAIPLLFVGLLGGGVLATEGRAQSAPQPARKVAVYELGPHERIALDGRLGEDAWERIEPITSLLQQEPVEGGAPTERTEIRLARDRSALYIGVTAFDSNPEGILAYQRRRNAGLGTDDRFMWVIDTYGDGRTAYFFEINPAGLRGDGLLRTGQGGGLNKSWDGIWDVRTARGDYGWSAEIRIPFRSLAFDPDLDAWGINFQRTVRRKNEEVVWAGHRRNQGLMRPQHAGRLTGMRGLSQGLGLEVRPYATASAEAMPRVGAASGTADAGFDLNYSITPNLQASLSVNTDFAEVEVDQRRVNLTRFPISFPEQRGFFLETANTFSFADASGVTPFFSRRIGLAGGVPVPIVYGARLNGQVAGTDLGFFQVRTGESELQPAEDFTAARLRRNLAAQSSAGLLYTRRATHGLAEQGPLPDRQTVGADLDLETSRFLGAQNLQFQSFWVWTSPSAAGDTTSSLDRSARGLRLAFPNAPWNAHVSYRELGPSYAPAVGFVSRTGLRRLQPSLSYSPILERNPLIRQLAWSLRFEYLTDMEFQPLTVGLGATLLDVRFESGDRVYLNVGQDFERLHRPFRLLGREDLEVLPGDYRTRGGTLGLRSASFRPVSGWLDVTREGFWSGDTDRLGTGFTLRPAPGIALGGSYSLNRLRLPDAGADVHLFILTSGLDLSPWTSASANLQYDNVSETLGLYSRLRWTIRPGSDLYAVYTHNWLTDEGVFATAERSGATKLSYTHRF